MAKFIVHKTNLQDARGRKVGDGEVIELTDAKLIRKFNSLGFLRPYIEDEVDADEGDHDDDDADHKPELIRARRSTAQPRSAEVPASAAPKQL